VANRYFEVPNSLDAAVIMYDGEQVGEDMVHVDGMAGEYVGPFTFGKLGS
jgi:pentose-5-phosphate-3-epimerase